MPAPPSDGRETALLWEDTPARLRPRHGFRPGWGVVKRANYVRRRFIHYGEAGAPTREERAAFQLAVREVGLMPLPPEIRARWTPGDDAVEARPCGCEILRQWGEPVGVWPCERHASVYREASDYGDAARRIAEADEFKG